MRFMYLRIPVIDTGDTAAQKVEKMKEEIDELLAEFCIGEVNTVDALSELFDVIQVAAGYLLAHTREKIITDSGAHDYVSTFWKHANERHIEKMRTYSSERGWHVVTN